MAYQPKQTIVILFFCIATINAENMPFIRGAYYNKLAKTIVFDVDYKGGCVEHDFRFKMGGCRDVEPYQCSASIIDLTLNDSFDFIVSRQISIVIKEIIVQTIIDMLVQTITIYGKEHTNAKFIQKKNLTSSAPSPRPTRLLIVILVHYERILIRKIKIVSLFTGSGSSSLYKQILTTFQYYKIGILELTEYPTSVDHFVLYKILLKHGNGCAECWGKNWRIINTMAETPFTSYWEGQIKCAKCSHAYKFHDFKNN
ncbi:hypothetical protein I4U23_022618 [Adineta vaga]|nr:hypothetical protein I4U23_022618 [Adineta vaga]